MAAKRTPQVRKMRKGFPDRLAEVQGSRSQRQFAADLKVFQQNVNRYLLGQVPHVDFLVNLATRENISIDWLLLGTGKMKAA